MPHVPRVLIVDDEANLRKVLAATLKREGYEVATAVDGEAAVAAIEEDGADVVVTDLVMPRRDGLSLLRWVLGAHPEIPVIVITAHGTIDSAVEALKLGAFDYITKPFEQEELKRAIAKATRASQLGAASVVSDEKGRAQMVGASPAMKKVLELIEKVADSPSTVLITGESGTGKELVAHRLHDLSSRRGRPFIRVNLAALPKELVESELFGYERGAFTGAVTAKPGRFELADQGTLFLDEIGEIPPEIQVKLLRVLQEGEFERVGGIKTQRVDVRLVAATNRDLKKDIEAGKFREDLYYRLNVVPIELPPLRERRSDIPILVEHFREKYNARLKRQVQGLEPAVIDLLVSYPWPGNIRELENFMERLVLFADGPTIRAAELPAEFKDRALATKPAGGPAAGEEAPLPAGLVPAELPEGASLKDIVRTAAEALERELITKALQHTGGNVTQAADRLKISRKTLQTKMKELGLRDAEERAADEA
ncbi:MAG TPA: sigma-54 dependent transcriptional regulator [Myxococcales bacterium]|nr:sigma-54 dependent transcriptional regulator [Myxococcales bacterium]